MFGNYDSWKTHSPDDEDDRYRCDDEPADECCHEEYEADILTGRSLCVMCGHSWYQTVEELQREHEHEIEYQKQCDEWTKEIDEPQGKSAATIDDTLPF